MPGSTYNKVADRSRGSRELDISSHLGKQHTTSASTLSLSLSHPSPSLEIATRRGALLSQPGHKSPDFNAAARIAVQTCLSSSRSITRDTFSPKTSFCLLPARCDATYPPTWPPACGRFSQARSECDEQRIEMQYCSGCREFSWLFFFFFLSGAAGGLGSQCLTQARSGD